MHESLVLMSWVRTTLAADATLTGIVGQRIYEGVAPQGAAYPYVLIAVLPGLESDVRGLSASILGVNIEFLCRAVGQSTSYEPLRVAADRIQALLHGGSGAVSPSGQVVACTRLAPASMVEVADGVTYRYLGGRYRGLVQAS